MIESNITEIANDTFSDCNNLTKITICSQAVIDSSTFISSLPSTTIIYVPESALDTYKTAWSVYSNRIQAIPTSIENYE
jgi:hypothetical protein